MASAPPRDPSDYIDAEPGEPPDEEPEQPDSAEECRVSLDVIEVDGEELAEVFAHGEAPGDDPSVAERKELLARVTANELIMLPRVSASYRATFLEPKYGQIVRIRIPGEWPIPGSIRDFDELLEALPVGFSRRAARGLGLKWEHRLIIEAIEVATGATELELVEGDEASLSGETFTLGRRRFERVRKAMTQIGDRARNRALVDRRNFAHNEIVHPVDQDRFPKKFREPRPGEIFELAQLSTREARRNEGDRSAAADLVRRDAPQIARENPRALLELRSVIERVTLAELISRYEALLARNPDERAWQSFFEAHPFVLSIAFPHPVLLIRGQAHVGGTTIDGSGESIADFLLRQRLTGSLAIVEIKTTRTRLLQNNPFRGNVYAAHADLCAAISQVLDQRAELTANYHARSRSPGMEETHVGHVHCLVIAGRDPGAADKRRSLDLFRAATKDVAVVTFDELLEKLKAIYQLMAVGASDSQTSNQTGPQ